MRSHRWAIAVFALAFVAAACQGGESNGAGVPPLALDGPSGVYIALGDSIAAGAGASNADSTSYVSLVAEALRARYGETLAVESLAVPGHTTEDLIAQQLPAAIARMREGDVGVVTLTIGGNDLEQYAAHAACVRDPSTPACPLEDGLLEVERRLSRILQELRAADPETTIVVQAYPNLYSGTGHEFERPADIAFNLLNGVITSVAARHDVLVADPRAAFLLNGNVLTHLLDRTPDAHPNDAGYRAIAAAFLEALGLPTTE